MSNSNHNKVRCHYDVLGISIDADTNTIKKAYRKLALQYHPDKNRNTTTTNTNTNTTTEQETNTIVLSYEQLFLQVQQAYECLSDPYERKWYDDHRDVILKGWTTTTTKTSTNTTSTNTSTPGNSSSNDTTTNDNDIVFNVVPYMYAGCYSGFDDTQQQEQNSFYHVYQYVFQQIYLNELNMGNHHNNHDTSIEYLNVPFGTSTSDYHTVVIPFYYAWENYTTSLSYTWVDQWNVQEADQRRIRRIMEDENLRLRRKAKKIRNDEILSLVRFVKRRDPRIIAYKEQIQHEKLYKEQQMKQLVEQRKMEKEKAMEEWKEQVERDAITMELNDRMNGRFRLADEEEDDDYEYSIGKKKKKKKQRGKGKHVNNTSGMESKSSSTNENNNDELMTKKEDDDDDMTHPMSTNPDGNNHQQQKSDVVHETRKEQNDNDITSNYDDDNNNTNTKKMSSSSSSINFRCDCCMDLFLKHIDMMNHLKSQKHKDMAALRKLEKLNLSSKTTSTPTTITTSTTTTTTTMSNTDSSIDPNDNDFNVHNTTAGIKKNRGKIKPKKLILESIGRSHMSSNTISKSVQPISISNRNNHSIDHDQNESPIEDDKLYDDDDDNDSDDDHHNPDTTYDDTTFLYWRCECCQKDFQSEGQMENHMNSKKHKSTYKLYERTMGKQLLYEVVHEIHQQNSSMQTNNNNESK